jgi:hypothetical protein
MSGTNPDFGYGGMLADGEGVDMMMNYPWMCLVILKMLFNSHFQIERI